jgi:hypothetical protein
MFLICAVAVNLLLMINFQKRVVEEEEEDNLMWLSHLLVYIHNSIGAPNRSEITIGYNKN